MQHIATAQMATGFAGIVTAAAAYSIWGGEMFPAEKDPTGGTLPRLHKENSI